MVRRSAATTIVTARERGTRPVDRAGRAHGRLTAPRSSSSAAASPAAASPTTWRGRAGRDVAAGREGRADQRLDLPRRRPRHPVQPVADDDALPPLQRRAVPRARRVRAARQPAHRLQPGEPGGAAAGREPRPRDRPRRRACVGPDEALALMPQASAGVALRRGLDARRRLRRPAHRHLRAGRRRPRAGRRRSAPRTRVTGIELGPRPRGARRSLTDRGRIETEHVVNACGIWAPQVSAMVGAFTPSVPVDHQHIALQAVPGHELPRDMPCFRDTDNLVYGTLRGRRRAVRRLRAEPGRALGGRRARGITARERCRPTSERFAPADGRAPRGASRSSTTPAWSRSCATPTR